MWSEYEGQLAALRFYSDKYDQNAVMAGAMFYYYGNYNPARGSGKDHIGPGWENDVRSYGTQCWPRIENSELIMNQVLGVAARLSGKTK